MEAHSSILAWRISWTEEPGDTVHGVAKSGTQLSRLSTHTLPILYCSIFLLLLLRNSLQELRGITASSLPLILS